MNREIKGDLLDFTTVVIIIYYFLRGADTTEELVRAFAVFDDDRDGLIPTEVARQVLTNLKHPIPPEHVDELLARLRSSGDQIKYADMITQLRPT
jgi:Ca2+-binding EF-hand superfamily protein